MDGSPHFNGPEYDCDRDWDRLTSQHARIRNLMLDGEYRTVQEISALTRDPENSIQAQLRHLRKPRFGGFIVTKRVRSLPALWEYHVRYRTTNDPPYLGQSKAELLEQIALLKNALLSYTKTDKCSGLLLCRVIKKPCRYCKAISAIRRTP
jgi:hypothetical protein